ncbi:DUF397 domain-containing protein [Kitasatospora aureofaciens]|uniref:DUF397 domain-containing protein n=1 Tax=Kitasatospora aureofaciens TaxID=1894 RepID=UPI001C46D97D|nr:DUF397 domain-containing protein [Kitasatospora aureofaciens]MBV6699851.1 DUF397 domain-containing protein [Kitasatospora aureofaciens]
MAAGLTWRKSSYSGGEGGNCVEVADAAIDIIAVRDSKDPHGPLLNFTAAAWQAFIVGIDTGTFPTTP